ncbi:hypothetical protein, partial [Klebsiella variicola]|uniref:hypothetical protein n=1 Tax=Klebsiella variicola TaxID=244366 RepID=UPI00272FF0C0
ACCSERVNPLTTASPLHLSDLFNGQNLSNTLAPLWLPALQPFPNNLSTKPPTAIVGNCVVAAKLNQENP